MEEIAASIMDDKYESANTNVLRFLYLRVTFFVVIAHVSDLLNIHNFRFCEMHVINVKFVSISDLI